jgi:hypothetical protein
MIERYSVSRTIGSELVRVGTLQRSARGQERFSYAESYLGRGGSPLSLSLRASSGGDSSAAIGEACCLRPTIRQKCGIR